MKSDKYLVSGTLGGKRFANETLIRYQRTMASGVGFSLIVMNYNASVNYAERGVYRINTDSDIKIITSEKIN